MLLTILMTLDCLTLILAALAHVFEAELDDAEKYLWFAFAVFTGLILIGGYLR